MVYFTCNYCGESIRKSSVERHYSLVCRRPKNLSCVDCLQDFNEFSFHLHTRCITEEAKYSAKNSGSEQKIQKGEVKQLAWLDVINHAYTKLCDDSPNHKEFLRQLKGYSNVPQKKPKFMNFVKSLSIRVHHTTAEAVWQLLWNTHLEINKKSQDVLHSLNTKIDSHSASAETSTNKEFHKKSAKKRKLTDVDSEKQSTNTLKTKVHGVSDANVDLTNGNGECTNKSNGVSHASTDLTNGHGGNVSNEPFQGKTKKFKWFKAIQLELKDATSNSLPVKRLRKQVLVRYQAYGGNINKAAKAKFGRKLLKHPRVKVDDDFAFLTPSPKTK